MPNRTTWPHAEESADSTHHALQSNTHAQYGTAAELNFANRCGGGLFCADYQSSMYILHKCREVASSDAVVDCLR